MDTVFAATLPFFLILGLGAATSYTKRFAGTEPAINAFVFWIALPAFLFDAIARTDPAAGVPPLFLLLAAGVTIVITVGAYALAHLTPVFRRVGPAQFSLAAGYGNVGYLAVPIVIALVGSDAALAVAIGQLLHNLVFMIGYPLIRTIVAQRTAAAAGATGGIAIWPIVKRALVANPVVLSIFAGLAVAVADIPLPSLIDDSVGMLGQAAIPAAMFAIGLTLRPALAGIRAGGIPPSAIIAATAVKLVVFPAVTLLLVRLFPGDLAAPWGPTLVLLAAMPVSSTAFILAEQYDGDGRFAAATIVVTSALAIVAIPLFAVAAGI